MTSPASPHRKRAWPLLLVAGLAFLPVLGFLFGSAAVTWALVSDRPRRVLSLILGATGAVLNLAVPILIVVLSPQGRLLTRRIEIDQTRQDLTTVVTELERFHTRTGQYPPTLRVLVGYPIPSRLINIYDHSQSILRWNHMYPYLASDDGTTYDVFAVGPDGIPYTADDVRPQIPDSLRQTVGYRAGP
jgi:hypothetical protein